MRTKNDSGFLSFPYLFLLLTAASLIVLFCSCGRSSNKKMINETPPTLHPPEPPKPPSMIGGDTIWNFTGKMPVLPGNEEALFDYIGRNLIYPESAKINGIQGKVIVKFCVTRNGNVTDYEVIKSVSTDLDAEALRVIKTITTFEPGYQDGKPVSVWYEVPISFKLH